MSLAPSVLGSELRAYIEVISPVVGSMINDRLSRNVFCFGSNRFEVWIVIWRDWTWEPASSMGRIDFFAMLNRIALAAWSYRRVNYIFMVILDMVTELVIMVILDMKF